MNILSIGLKGFKRSPREGGICSWTPEVLLEYDQLYPELSEHQKVHITRSLDEQRELLMSLLTSWEGEETARLEVRTPSSPRPPVREPVLPADPPEGAGRALPGTDPPKAPAPASKAPPASTPGRRLMGYDRPPAPPQNGTRKAGDEYDAEAKRWTRCVCGNKNINFEATGTGRPYQMCQICGLFLNSDGTVKARNGGK